MGGADRRPAHVVLLELTFVALGGLTAGATAMWRGVQSGLLHGILVWALGVVAFAFLTLFGWRFVVRLPGRGAQPDGGVAAYERPRCRGRPGRTPPATLRAGAVLGLSLSDPDSIQLS